MYLSTKSLCCCDDPVDCSSHTCTIITIHAHTLRHRSHAERAHTQGYTNTDGRTDGRTIALRGGRTQTAVVARRESSGRSRPTEREDSSTIAHRRRRQLSMLPAPAVGKRTRALVGFLLSSGSRSMAAAISEHYTCLLLLGRRGGLIKIKVIGTYFLGSYITILLLIFFPETEIQ